MSVVYGGLAVVALVLLVLCVRLNIQHEKYLTLLCVSVLVCNVGYWMLSVAPSLSFALAANRVVYLGNVFLPFFLFMMILKCCGQMYPKVLPVVLLIVGVAVWLLAASPGILDVYYQTVSLQRVHGASIIKREYGPLHVVYLLYILSYTVVSLAVIVYTMVKKTLTHLMQAFFLLTAVLVNVAIWLVERFFLRGFEFLSVSYIMTEIFLLLLSGLMNQMAASASEGVPHSPVPSVAVDGTAMLFSDRERAQILARCDALAALTPREHEVLEHILSNKKRKEIAEALFVTESTIKKYTSSIYKKLGVSNRIELFIKLRQYL